MLLIILLFRISLLFLTTCIATISFAHLGPHHELELLRNELKKAPDNKELLFKEGFVLNKLGHHEASIQSFTVLIRRYPNDTRLYYHRAQAYKNVSQFEQAIQDLTDVIESGKFGKNVYVERAEIHEKFHRHAKALKDYQIAIKEKQSEIVYLEYGRLVQKIGRSDESAKIYHHGCKIYPHSTSLTQAVVRIEIELRNFDKALKAVNSMMDNRNFKTPWLLLKGEIFRAMGHRDKVKELQTLAMKECDQKLAKKRGKIIYKLYKGEVLLAMGNKVEASRIVTSILDKIPDYHAALDLKHRIDQ